ncbi:MAG: hypothetical protein VYA34_07240 [Myxococcota bacterium]|nr:hypothetical protein [Myxococcota bacterium]
MNEKLVAPDTVEYGGFCSQCNIAHTLKNDALSHQLLKEVVSEIANPKHPDHPGEMKTIGVLLAQKSAHNQLGYLKAFSGSLHQGWNREGWCPTPAKLEEFEADRPTIEAEIGTLTLRVKEMRSQEKQCTEEYRLLKEERANISRALTQRIHRAYAFGNFQRQHAQMVNIYLNHTGKRPPTGTGECAAPKLIQSAIKLDLKPISICEAVYQPSKGGKHTLSAPTEACSERCYPILGFMLCGLNGAQ